MGSKKRKILIKYDNEFLSELETFMKKNDTKFKIGKCDFSIDPKNIKKHAIKIEFRLKTQFQVKIENDMDESQTNITSFSNKNTLKPTQF